MLLQVAYGLPPCDIAALCRKPCREVRCWSILIRSYTLSTTLNRIQIPLMRMLLEPKGDRDIARPQYNTNPVELDASTHNVEFGMFYAIHDGRSGTHVLNSE